MKSKPPIIFDTNTLISALILPSSITHKALTLAIEHFDLITSANAWDEFLSRITKTSLFHYFESKEHRDELVMTVAKIVKYIPVQSEITDCGDSDDNKFLALALDGKAQFLITGDGDLKILHPWRGITIISPGDFVRQFENH